MSLPPRGRTPTIIETAQYQKEFPNLSSFAVTGEADSSYDCVSLTVMPESPRGLQPSAALVALGGIDALDRFYGERHFSRVGSAPKDPGVSCIAIFALEGIVTHVALRDQQPGWWESKLGTGLRILHPLEGLEGGRYGAVIGYYSASKRPSAFPPSISVETA